jgi:hypothetical protein
MAYSTGGNIQAIDYNYLAAGGNTQVATAAINNVFYVLGSSKGPFGYGQDCSAITPVSVTPATTTITAAQWASLVYLVNRGLGHQSGAGAQLASGSNIGITPGATISAFANVSAAVTTINTNANVFTAQGTTTTGTGLNTSIVFTGSTSTAANTASFTRTVTFGSGDQARYFFNAGGQINFTLTATNNNATLRSADLVTNWASGQGGGSIKGTTAGARTGSGQTLTSENLNLGYWSCTGTNQSMRRITSNNYRYEYNTDFTQVGVKTNGVQGSNNDNGTIITFQFDVSLAGAINAAMTGPYNDNVDVTLTVRFDIVEPETTFLTKTWVNPTIA